MRRRVFKAVLLAAALLTILMLLCSCAALQAIILPSPSPVVTTPALTPPTSSSPSTPSEAPITSSPTAPSTPASPESPSNELTVRTDWSKLSPAGEPLPVVGTRWYNDYVGELIPNSNYGILIPYAGARLMHDWPARTGCVYGLMTTGGMVVTDAIYSSVYRPGYYSNTWNMHPLLVLYQNSLDTSDTLLETPYAIAAVDGSWCTGARYFNVISSESGLLLFEKTQVSQMSTTGEILNRWSAAQLRLTESEFNSLLGDSYYEGGAQWAGDYLHIGSSIDGENLELIHLPTTSRVKMNYREWFDYVDSQYPSPEHEPPTPSLPEEQFGMVEFIRDLFTDDGLPGLFTTSQYGLFVDIYLPDGTHIPELSGAAAWYYRIQPVGGLIEVLDLNNASYYKPDTMECVFRTYFGYELD